ncbi:MAG: hypothetical protein ABIQ51_22770, partial [Mesorhizobium sp.]
RRMVDAAAKAAQFPKDMLVSFERKEEDKSLGRGECKEAGFFFLRNFRTQGRGAVFLELP